MEVSTLPWANLLDRHAGLRLLVLLGSRARGDARETSDWDLGFLPVRDADEHVDLLALRADVVSLLGTDRVDLVPLAEVSAVLRRDAAAQGQLLAERETEAFVEFQVEATSYWCDVEPVVREAHADVLRAAMR